MSKRITILAFALFTAVTLGIVFAQVLQNPTAIEQRMFDLINIERANHGLPPYIWHDTLAGIARAHSEDMLRNNFLGNTSSDGSAWSSQRIRGGGITNAVESRIFVYGGADTPEQRLTDWMNSSAHRAIMLQENLSHASVAIIQRPSGSNARHSAYWTLMFIEIPPVFSPAEVQDFEYRVFELTNIERVNHGLPPFIWHDALADVARAHAEDLMVNNMRGHIGSDGSTVRQRIERSGITNGRSFAENVTYARNTPERAVESWMNSPGHRANILNETRTHLGVGFVQRPEGSNAQYTSYCVQKFIAFR